MMAVADVVKYKINHLDVAQAFTKAMFDYEVCMKLHGGCVDFS